MGPYRRLCIECYLGPVGGHFLAALCEVCGVLVGVGYAVGVVAELVRLACVVCRLSWWVGGLFVGVVRLALVGRGVESA